MLALAVMFATPAKMAWAQGGEIAATNAPNFAFCEQADSQRPSGAQISDGWAFPGLRCASPVAIFLHPSGVNLDADRSFPHQLAAVNSGVDRSFLAQLVEASGAAQDDRAGNDSNSAQGGARSFLAGRAQTRPARAVAAERFLARRGGAARGTAGAHRRGAAGSGAQARAMGTGGGSASWLPLGPTAVQTQNFGLITGRISSLALDPSDITGNTLYVGTTGGGVWRSQNADTSIAANISFIPLTDDLSALTDVMDASISIGALTVQPGGTGVILAGTGDPNDALDSYYGAGILRSADGGNTWSLIPSTSDHLYSFMGEGFAGFAWSTVNQQLVVAAVSEAYEGRQVNAVWPGVSYKGLYYSTDGGASWSLATITDGAGADVQGPNDGFAPDGNAATAVVWNPVRRVFVAAVRHHGYYQSTDGITWTRLANQPGAGLQASLKLCPANTGNTGSLGCPIYRGALAVNPQTGDTFAWTVADYKGEYNYDLGIWQDECGASGGSCAEQTIGFGMQWNTAALERNAPLDTSIQNGDYNLTLAAIPSGQTTILLAGANDLWKSNCPQSQGCAWRNTTNSTTCMSAAVGEYQHALAWNASNPLEIFAGNDSGLWRSTDAVGETGAVCSASDATHFQNLNGSLGSLAEVVSISQAGATPYTMMAGLANGIVGVSNTSAATVNWPEILGGAGPVAIDPSNAQNWYANDEPGVSIYLGTPPSGSTPGTFSAVLNYSTDPGALTTTHADVVRDGLYLAAEPPYAPAAFLVDPLDHTKLLIATCRVWRGPASGVGWTAANAITPILDGITGDNDCSVNAFIRSMAAMALPVSGTLPSGGEVVYVGMYGGANGGGTLPGHVLSTTYNSATGVWSAAVDVTLGTVTNVSNATGAMNYYGLDISSIFIDPHDTTGNTVYVTVAGVQNLAKNVQVVYRSVNGGASWLDISSNLPVAPANSVVVDTGSAGTVYVATDAGVFATQEMLTGNCNTVSPGCWAPLGSGLPEAPVVALSAQPASAPTPELIAGTYGRGIWMTPLLGAGSAGTGPATGALSATVLSFSNTVVGQLSAAQYITLTNSGGALLTSIVISTSGAFVQSNNCTANLAPMSSCTISVQYYPSAASAQTGTLTVTSSAADSPRTVALSGTGVAAPALSATPASLSFGGQLVGQSSAPQTVTVRNTGGAPLANVGFQITGQSAGSFAWSASTCTATLSNVSGQNSCTVQVVFTPATAGGATAELAVSSTTSGVQAVTVALTGTGQTVAGINVSPAQLAFPIVSPGQSSPAQTVSVTNSISSAVSSLTFTATPPFSVVLNSCGSTLAGNGSCMIGVNFSPSLNGPYTGSLTIASGGVALASVPLTGTGGVPGSVQFLGPTPPLPRQIGVGLTSSASTVTITNPDSVNSLGSFAVAVSTGFKLVNNTCAATLAAAASCTVGVEFAPTSPGVQNGSLTVTSSSLPTGSFLALTGMGFDFGLASTGSSSATVASGQTANYKLVVTPLMGSQGVFSFQCGTLPPYTLCSFNPASEGIPANSTGNVLVQIATGLSTTTASLARPPRWPVLPLACGLLLLPLALWRRRRALLVVAMLAMLVGGVSSCASSSGGGLPPLPPASGPGITPAATYSIPVIVTSNGVQHQLTLTLTVD